MRPAAFIGMVHTIPHTFDTFHVYDTVLMLWYRCYTITPAGVVMVDGYRLNEAHSVLLVDGTGFVVEHASHVGIRMHRPRVQRLSERNRTVEHVAHVVDLTYERPRRRAAG